MNIGKLIRDAIAYMASTSNPAGVSAAQIDTYTRKEVDDRLLNYIPAGSFNASKYGDNSWPRPNVLGNWRGGQRDESHPSGPIIDEPDGSLTIIENATDGTSAGAYYTFLTDSKNPNGSWNFNLNPTPVAYSPSILTRFPGTWKVLWVGSSEGNTVVWGQMQNVDTLEVKYFVALTNGTGDQKQHICTTFTLADGLEVNYRNRGMLVRNKVVFFAPDVLKVTVSALNVSDIIAGTEAVLTRVVGWTNDVINTTNTSDGILLAGTAVSTDINADSVCWKDTNANPGGYQSRLFAAAHPSDNKVRLHIANIFRFTFAGGDTTATCNYILDLDLDLKTAAMHSETKEKLLMSNNGALSLISTGKQPAISSKYLRMNWNWHGDVAISDSGRLFITRWANEGLGSLESGVVTSAGLKLTAWDKLHPDNFNYVSSYNRQIYRRFGSLMGGNAMFKSSFPDNNVLVSSVTSSPTDHATPQNILSMTRNFGSPTGYTYKTDSGDIKGFYPSSDKQQVKVIYTSNSMAALVQGVSKKVTSVGAGMLDPKRGVRESVRQLKLVDGTLTNAGAGVLSLTGDAGMNAIVASLIAAEGTKLGADVIYNYQLWVPPKGTREYPPLLIVNLYSPSVLNGMVLYYNAQVTLSSGTMENGVIGNVTLGTLIFRREAGWAGTSLADSFSAGFVYEHCLPTGDVVWAGLFTPVNYYFNTIGGNEIPRLSMTIVPGENAYTAANAQYRSSSSWYHGNDPLTVIDGIGPVLLNLPLGRTGGGAAFYYRKIDLTADRSSFLSPAPSTNDPSNYVLVSSLVSDEFKLYFTDNQDSLIDSVYYEVSSVIQDLVDVDPSPGNKKFYVYLSLVNGEVTYVISTLENAPFDLYIGYVVTNATQIIQIEIVKATKFDW